MMRISTFALLVFSAASLARGAEATSATVPATGAATATASRPAIVMPEGKNWKIIVPPKGLQVTVLVPKKWEKTEPTDKSPPLIYQPGSAKNTHRAAWYFLLLDAKKDKPQRVLDRAIVSRTDQTKDFEIREQKTFTRADGQEVATLFYTARDEKGNMIVSRETYYWVDEKHLLIALEWSTRGAWGDVRKDLEAMTASIKVQPFAAETQPSTAPAKK